MSLAAMLPFLKLLAVFGAMLLAIRKKLQLALAVLLGAGLLALFFGLPLWRWPATVFAGLTDITTLYLAAIVGLILLLSDLLKVSGQAERLLASMTGMLARPRLALVFFPALIGLLPMPGGAVFSAPMIGSVADKVGGEANKDAISGPDRVALNYWFRHVWEFCWPLYPGIILAAGLSEEPILAIAAIGLPGTALSLFLGWRFLLAPGRLALPERVRQEAEAAFNPLTALKEGAPLVTAILASILLESLFATTGLLDAELGVILALCLAIGLGLYQNSLGAGFLRTAVTRKHLWTMLAVICAIFVFKQTMGDAGVVTALSEAAGGTAALLASATLLPFLVGFVSGITIAFVGATFPLFLGILEATGQQELVLPFVVLGLFSGFSGVMVSPLHICFILTCEYFNVEIGQAWRRIALPSMLLFLGGVAYFFLLRAVL